MNFKPGTDIYEKKFNSQNCVSVYRLWGLMPSYIGIAVVYSASHQFYVYMYMHVIPGIHVSLRHIKCGCKSDT